MIIPYNNHYNISTSPHSIGLNNNLTVPNPLDGNWFINNEKRFFASGMQGLGGGRGMGCPSCSGNYGVTTRDMMGYGAGGGGFGDLSTVMGDLSTTFGDIMDSFSNMTMIDWLGIAGISLAILLLWDKGKSSGRKR